MTTSSLDADLSPPSLPDEVLGQIRRVLGEVGQIDLLGGMSGSRVVRARGAGGAAVVKGGATAAEVEFYAVVAPILRGIGVGVPDLLWAGRAAGERWLVIEAIPHPLPRDRWGPDPGVIVTLARLHRAGKGGIDLPPLRAPDAFRPAWTAEATAAALAVLGHVPVGDGGAVPRPHPSPGDRAETTEAGTPAGDLAGALASMQAEAAPLFASDRPLSGDPNPGNWGLRDDGRLVLFDWERFCYGAPALDLAPVVPGLGTPDETDAVATAYVAAVSAVSPGAAPDRAILTRETTLAKAWNVVEMLAGSGGTGREPERTAPLLEWLRADFPAWARAVAAAGRMDRGEGRA